jgi:hypothetical protein
MPSYHQFVFFSLAFPHQSRNPRLAVDFAWISLNENGASRLLTLDPLEASSPLVALVRRSRDSTASALPTWFLEFKSVMHFYRPGT